MMDREGCRKLYETYYYYFYQNDSEKHREVGAACVSSKFEPSTKAINEHGQGKNHIEYKIHWKEQSQNI